MSTIPTEQPQEPLAAGVARSAIWATGGQIAILVATFVATPFTIRLLGPSAYGVSALILSVNAYLRLADLGMAGASTRFASDRFARDDSAGEASVVWSALALTGGLTLLAALLVGIEAPSIVSGVLHAPSHLRSQTTLALRLLCIGAVWMSIATTVNTPQQVRLRWRSVTLATSGPALLQVAAAPVLLAAISPSLIVIGAVVASASLASAILNGLVALRLQPLLRRPTLVRSLVRQLAGYGGGLAVASLASIPLMTAERFFLAHYTSSITVAYYAVANTLGTLLLIVPSAVVQPLLPALTRLSSQGRTDEHRQLYHQALRGVFLLVVPVALAVAFLASPFLTLWAGHSYGVHSAGPLYIVLAGVCALTLSWVPFSQMLAAGQTRLLAQIHLAELGPYLVLAAVLTSAHGAIGAAVAWSTRCVADAAIYFAVTHRVYRLPVTPTPRRAVSFLIAVALLAAAFLGLAALTHSLVFRAASATVVLVAFAAGTWRIVLTPQEQTGLGAVAGQVIPPKLRSWVGRPAAGAHNQF